MTEPASSGSAKAVLLPLLAGLCVYAVLIAFGNRMLADPDTFWQIRIGQWILDNGAVPRADSFSFTMHGQPWISTQWLAQVLYAGLFSAAGWSGPVALAAASIAAAFALLARYLEQRFDRRVVLIFLLASFAIASSHFLVRPHALAMPVMVAWVAGLLDDADRGRAPSFWLLPLMTVWANLHGSFVFGLVLIGAFALDALTNADRSARRRILLRWLLFGLLALGASCLTPYGWNSLLAAGNILNLGAALSMIAEWRPADFTRFGTFQAVLLLGLGAALFKGVKLPLMRIVLTLGLLHMALASARNVTVMALVLPMVLATPLATFLGRTARSLPDRPRWRAIAISAVMVPMVVMATLAITQDRYSPPSRLEPAVAVLKQRGASRVLNDYDFGGYLIWSGVPVAIDGRTELYGERFMVEIDRAMNLKSAGALFDVFETYRIDATLLWRKTPAAQMLDHVDGWKKVFVDGDVVAHIRDPSARHSVEPEIKPASN